MKPLSIACLSLLTIASISYPAFSKPKEEISKSPIMCVRNPCPTRPPTEPTPPPAKEETYKPPIWCVRAPCTLPSTTEPTFPKTINQDRPLDRKD
jgi:hypothetical protein